MWINKQDGICLDDSLHAGLPVTNGEKWILIVWVRENKFI
jgi:prolyl 4-hydroxylase